MTDPNVSSFCLTQKRHPPVWCNLCMVCIPPVPKLIKGPACAPSRSKSESNTRSKPITPHQHPPNGNTFTGTVFEQQSDLTRDKNTTIKVTPITRATMPTLIVVILRTKLAKMRWYFFPYWLVVAQINIIIKDYYHYHNRNPATATISNSSSKPFTQSKQPTSIPRYFCKTELDDKVCLPTPPTNLSFPSPPMISFVICRA